MSWGLLSARILLGIYSVLLALALFSPTSHLQYGAVIQLSSLLGSHGIPEKFVTYPRLEVLMNAAIVAPLTFLASLSWPAWSWRDWTAAGFLGAVAVELTQGLLLPDRQAAFSDIVANTAGALAGALLGAFVHALARPILRTKTARQAEAAQ